MHTHVAVYLMISTSSRYRKEENVLRAELFRWVIHSAADVTWHVEEELQNIAIFV